jgi:hypothetical protein
MYRCHAHQDAITHPHSTSFKTVSKSSTSAQVSRSHPPSGRKATIA